LAEETLSEVPEGVMLSLVGLREGSECLVFSVPEAVVPIVAEISDAIFTRRFSVLPEDTYDALRGLSKVACGHGWSLEIREDQSRNIRNAKIGADNPLEPLGSPASVHGTTTIHGTCLRVGGATVPKAEIRLSANQKLKNVDLSRELAKELASRLYEDVVLEIQAVWDTETWEITPLRVNEVADYRKTDLAAAFRELAEAAGGHWDGIDAVAYVHELRSNK
jgi:hypothetical protein